ncbi:MAG: restriction endonuclease subunit S [Cetobacterium sp.]
MKNKVPKLRFPEFSGEWEEKKLGEICDVRDGTHDSPKYIEKGYPFVTSKNLMTNGQISFKDVNYISEDDYISFNKRSQVAKGDILFGMIGTIGNPVIVNKEGFAIKNVALIKEKEFLKNNFLLQLLKSSMTEKQFHILNTGGTQKFISLGIIRDLVFNTPSLPEQKKIASFLSEVDTKIEKLEKKKELLSQYKKGMMQKLFSQKLRFKEENGNDYPEWEEKNGSDIFENISNKNHSSDLPILAITQDKGAIPREMIDMKVIVSESSIESYKVVNKGDFIISLRSFQGGIEYSAYDGICSPAYIILKPKNEIIDNFFKNYLKTERYIQKLCSKLEGIRDGKMISYKYFSEIKLPFPSLTEQEKIANFLFSIDRKIELVEEELVKNKDFKKGLLQQMFV